MNNAEWIASHGADAVIGYATGYQCEMCAKEKAADCHLEGGCREGRKAWLLMEHAEEDSAEALAADLDRLAAYDVCGYFHGYGHCHTCRAYRPERACGVKMDDALKDAAARARGLCDD